ncbi:MAG: ribonuclease HII [Thermodesulfobacteriota bacterium]
MTANGEPVRAFEDQARQNGFFRIAGADEVGRGPLAGPVVSAAVILPAAFSGGGLTDSKKLTAKQRSRWFDRIYEQALTIGIGIVDPVEIDRINILQASLAAMAMAVGNLLPGPDFVLIDGTFAIPVSIEQQPIAQGDSRSISIAAASVVAKVTRDRMMVRYAEEYPEYGFSSHKGYATKSHVAAIRQNGCCPIHRQSFRGVCPQYRQEKLF